MIRLFKYELLPSNNTQLVISRRLKKSLMTSLSSTEIQIRKCIRTIQLDSIRLLICYVECH